MKGGKKIGKVASLIKRKKVMEQANRVINNNFQSKPMLQPMNGRLRFPQVKTHSPLFYVDIDPYGRKCKVITRTAGVK